MLDVRAVNDSRHLHWLTALTARIGSKRVFAPVANRSRHQLLANARIATSRVAS